MNLKFVNSDDVSTGLQMIFPNNSACGNSKQNI